MPLQGSRRGERARDENETTTIASPSPSKRGVSPRWRGALDAEMQAAAETIAEWQRESGKTQVELADRVRELTPDDDDGTLGEVGGKPRRQKRAATNSTISRWRDPNRFRRAHFETIRIAAEAAGRSLRDLVERMEARRLEYELQQIGASTSLVEALHARHQQEQDLLADFRVLDPREKRILLAQARGMARPHIEANAPDSDAYEAMSVAEIVASLPQPTNDPDEALRRVIEEIRGVEAREREDREGDDRARAKRPSFG